MNDNVFLTSSSNIDSLNFSFTHYTSGKERKSANQHIGIRLKTLIRRKAELSREFMKGVDCENIFVRSFNKPTPRPYLNRAGIRTRAMTDSRNTQLEQVRNKKRALKIVLPNPDIERISNKMQPNTNIIGRNRLRSILGSFHKSVIQDHSKLFV